jgi:hypothetical protein
VTLLSLLDLLCQLQATADQVAEVLLAQAPAEVQQVEASNSAASAYSQRTSHSL